MNYRCVEKIKSFVQLVPWPVIGYPSPEIRVILVETFFFVENTTFYQNLFHCNMRWTSILYKTGSLDRSYLRCSPPSVGTSLYESIQTFFLEWHQQESRKVSARQTLWPIPKKARNTLKLGAVIWKPKMKFWIEASVTLITKNVPKAAAKVSAIQIQVCSSKGRITWSDSEKVIIIHERSRDKISVMLSFPSVTASVFKFETAFNSNTFYNPISFSLLSLKRNLMSSLLKVLLWYEKLRLLLMSSTIRHKYPEQLIAFVSWSTWSALYSGRIAGNINRIGIDLHKLRNSRFLWCIPNKGKQSDKIFVFIQKIFKLKNSSLWQTDHFIEISTSTVDKESKRFRWLIS